MEIFQPSLRHAREERERLELTVDHPDSGAPPLGIDLDKLNVNGGAIALGHPFGMTGARLQATMVNSLQTHDKQLGLISLCVGGGQGMALVLERLS